MEKDLKNKQKILEPLSNTMMVTEINDIELVKLRKINFKDFKDFIYSLKSERETWSLDTNMTGFDDKPIGDIKNTTELRRWYEVMVYVNQTLVCTNKNKEILGISYYIRYTSDFGLHGEILLANYMVFGDFKANNIKFPAQVSVVVGKKSQGKGIGKL